MFSADELRRFVRDEVDRALVDDLPGPRGISLSEYASQVAEGLEWRRLVKRPLFEALARERPGWRDEIMALLARVEAEGRAAARVARGFGQVNRTPYAHSARTTCPAAGDQPCTTLHNCGQQQNPGSAPLGSILTAIPTHGHGVKHRITPCHR
ncbi:MAG: hypothetical protein AAGC55_03750 [Myxococcota bacterium]